MFRRVTQNTAKEEVALQITAAIAEGRLGRDDKLPSERQLAEQFAVSRATVREAMQHLSALGVVEIRRGLGTYVLGSERPDRDDLSPDMLFETRFGIEPYIAQLCALRATGADLEQMAYYLDLSEPEGADFERYDNQFHLAVAKATRNTLLSRAADDIFSQRNTATWGSLKDRSLTPQRVRTFTVQHRYIFNAIRDRDPLAAERAMRIHLFTASYAVLGTWPPLPPGWQPIEFADLPEELQAQLQPQGRASLGG
jgi:DNA-binding FadR family transcriptional regulator